MLSKLPAVDIQPSAISRIRHHMKTSVSVVDEIDRTSEEPFYLQLTNLIEDAIQKGIYQPGTQIPTESELCRKYNLSRATVRQSLRTLEERNSIRLVARRGAFVVDKKGTGWVLQVAEGFFEGEVDHDHRSVHTEVLETGVVPMPGAVAIGLNCEEGDPCFMVRRLRRLDGKEALVSVNYLLPELKDVVINSEVMKPSGSLNRVLNKNGYLVFGARRTVEAVAAPTAVAKLLGVVPGSPLLLVSSVSWDENLRPFDYYTSWVRTDVVKVTVEASAVPAIRG